MAMPIDPPWEELHGNLRAFIGRRVKNPADVEDLVQRVLLHICKGLGSLRDTERLYAWVYRTARNVIIDYYRSPALRREIPAADAQDLTLKASIEHFGTKTLEEGEGASQDLATCMMPLLLRLPPAYREAITLTDLEGLNQADAARRTGVSLSGMKSRVQRGRKQLRAILEDCCRIHLDRRGGVVAYERRHHNSCSPCRTCAD